MTLTSERFDDIASRIGYLIACTCYLAGGAIMCVGGGIFSGFLVDYAFERAI